MCYFNVTDHAVTVERPCGERFTIRPSGPVARVIDIRRVIAEADEVPIRLIEEQEIVGLPEPSPDRIYIASLIVARVAAAQGRRDVVAPDTSMTGGIRGPRGRVRAVRGFQQFPPIGGVEA
jgi:hypothetical protein